VPEREEKKEGVEGGLEGEGPGQTASVEQMKAGEEGSPFAGESLSGAQEDMAKELEQARKKVCELEDRILRLAAEQENFKKRMQREREISLKYAEESILRELLPSLDNLERAMEQGRNADVATLLAGVEMTRKSLLSTLEKIGLTSLDAAGQPFDPNFHEALAMEASDDVAENVILQEYQKGYMFKDRLIRAAKVVVSTGRAAQQQ
jgi:molecular chaperone GrpE